MADSGSERRDGGEKGTDETMTSAFDGGSVETTAPDSHANQSEDELGMEPTKTSVSSGYTNKLADIQSHSPPRSVSPSAVVVTPSEAAPSGLSGVAAGSGVGDPVSLVSVRRVSFQQESNIAKREDNTHSENSRTDDLQVPPGTHYTPSISPSPSASHPMPDHAQQGDTRRLLGRKRNSEWVFRPLKLKFKVRELEELYRNYVYRQQQSLVCTACLIMVGLSVMVAISFLVNVKVCSMGMNVYDMYSGTVLGFGVCDRVSTVTNKEIGKIYSLYQKCPPLPLPPLHLPLFLLSCSLTNYRCQKIT